MHFGYFGMSDDENNRKSIAEANQIRSLQRMEVLAGGRPVKCPQPFQENDADSELALAKFSVMWKSKIQSIPSKSNNNKNQITSQTFTAKGFVACYECKYVQLEQDVRGLQRECFPEKGGMHFIAEYKNKEQHEKDMSFHITFHIKSVGNDRRMIMKEE